MRRAFLWFRPVSNETPLGAAWPTLCHGPGDGRPYPWPYDWFAPDPASCPIGPTDMRGALIFVIVPGLVLMALVLWAIAALREAHDLVQAETAVVHVAARVETELALLQQELRLFASLPSVKEADLARMEREAALLAVPSHGALALVENGPVQRKLFDVHGLSAEVPILPQDLRPSRPHRDRSGLWDVQVSNAFFLNGLDLPVFQLTKPLATAEFPDHQLVMTVALPHVAERLAGEGLPPDALAVVIDGAGQIIGRSDDAPITFGTPVPEAVLTELTALPRGSTDRTLEGLGQPRSITAWARLDSAPDWTVAVSLPTGQPGLGLGSAALPAALAAAVIALLAMLHVRSTRLGQWAEAARLAETRLQEQATERAAQDRELRALRREAQLRNEHMAMLRHDMRTSILGTQDVIKRLIVADRAQNQGFHLSSVLSASNRMLRLIEDCEATPPAEGARPVTRIAPFSPRALLADLAPMVEGVARKNGTIVTTDIAENIPWMKGDAALIGQMVLNLLGNAAKFTRNGIVTLTARAEPVRTAPLRARLVVSVSDTGIGIAKKDIERIFTPRFRGAQASDQPVEGSGLGLAIVKRLVDAMDGTITVDSVPGQGSVFKLVLPLEVALPPERAPEATPLDGLAGKRVLLVDDDPMMLMAGSKALQNAGALVLISATAEDALDACRETALDALVLDLLMPGVEIEPLLQQIRQATAPRAIPVIAFSGNMDAARAAECRAMGFDAAIQKDADLALTVAAVLATAPQAGQARP